FRSAPSSTRISLRTPSNGDGTSALTLSVMTSSSGSYLATWSPGFLSHLPIVPSATLSPSWGMVTFATCLPPLAHSAASLPHLPRPRRARRARLAARPFLQRGLGDRRLALDALGRKRLELAKQRFVDLREVEARLALHPALQLRRDRGREAL